VKYTNDLLALSCGDRCRWARTFVRQFFIAIRRALRSTGVRASRTKRGSYTAGMTRVYVRRSTGSWVEPNSPSSCDRQLSLFLVHPRLPLGNCVLLTYIHRDLSITSVRLAGALVIGGCWMEGRVTGVLDVCMGVLCVFYGGVVGVFSGVALVFVVIVSFIVATTSAHLSLAGVALVVYSAT
jgi:hypothetical protein